MNIYEEMQKWRKANKELGEAQDAILITYDILEKQAKQIERINKNQQAIMKYLYRKVKQ